MPLLAPPAVPVGRLTGQPQPVLSRGALTLRAFEPADVDRLVEVYSDPEIQRWHVQSLTSAEAAEWIAARNRRWAARSGVDWAVVSDGEIAGRIGLETMDLRTGVAEVVYWTAASHRGRGIATVALALLVDWALELGFGRLELLHSVHNAGSCRVALAGGFALEATKRHAGLHADGWHDMHLHARIPVD